VYRPRPPSQGDPVSPENPKKREEGEEAYDDPPMTLWDHLKDLRKRMFYSIVAFALCAGIAWEFRELLLSLLVKPYADAWRSQGIPGEPTIHFQTPAAAFVAYFKLSLLGGAVGAGPVIFSQLWLFIAPGLYAKEKKFVIPFALCSTGLFVGGGYFGWRLVFPLAFEYLLGLSGDLGAIGTNVVPTVMMGEYISFVTRMLVGFGVIFEIPLLVFFLSIAGIVNYLHLIRYGRWFVVVAFVAAAMITPPDITSQVMMAIPMVVLYTSSILLAWIFGKPPPESQKEAYRKAREDAKKDRAADRERKRVEKEAEKLERAEEKKRAKEEKARIKADKKAAKEAAKKG
jgi:sec-independent protein translocase protein TatC